jgi:hypothetical protein
MLRTKKVVHTLDAAAEENKPLSARLAGARSHIVVPMLKDDEVIGAIAIYRKEVRPFTEKQIELVTNFAAQSEMLFGSPLPSVIATMTSVALDCEVSAQQVRDWRKEDKRQE